MNKSSKEMFMKALIQEAENRGEIKGFKKAREKYRSMKEFTQREIELIYFGLSRLLDDTKLSPTEFNEIDSLRDKFYQGEGE